jgi:hypothetical protein
MFSWERKIIAFAMLLSIFWGGGLVVVYLLRDSSSTPALADLETPQTIRGNETAAPAVSQINGALVFPTAQPVAPVSPDVNARRQHLMELRSHMPGNNRSGSMFGFQSRYQNRTGTVLALASLAPPTPPPPEPAASPTTAPTTNTTTATTAPTTAPISTPVADATLISVHLSKASLRQVLVAVATAGKVKIAVSPPGWIDSDQDNQSIDLNADNQPLMEVMNELCCKSASQLRGGNNDMSWGGEMSAADPATPLFQLQHQQADASLGPWVVSGAFSFEAQRLFHTAALDSAASAAALQLTVKATHEPSIVVCAADMTPTITEAVDDKGKSLISDNVARPAIVMRRRRGFSFAQVLAAAVGAAPPPDAAPLEPWNPQASDLTIQLNCPPGFGHTIVKLSGSEKYLVQKKAARLEMAIANPPIAQDKTLDGISLTVDNWQIFGGQQCRFRLTIHRTNQTPVQWSRLQASMRQLHPVLQDSSGTPFPAPRGWNSNNTNTECFCEYMSQGNGYYDQEAQNRKPAKLLIDVPTDFVTMDVPFKFENLPLP